MPSLRASSAIGVPAATRWSSTSASTHALLEPAIGTLSALWDELRELEQAVVVIDLLEPEQARAAIVHELVERRRPPVVRARLTVDAEYDGLPGRERDPS